MCREDTDEKADRLDPDQVQSDLGLVFGIITAMWDNFSFYIATL